MIYAQRDRISKLKTINFNKKNTYYYLKTLNAYLQLKTRFEFRMFRMLIENDLIFGFDRIAHDCAQK